jgi:hypothetical protein
MGRGFGKLGGEEAVTVFSQDAPEAMVLDQGSNETRSAAVLKRLI